MEQKVNNGVSQLREAEMYTNGWWMTWMTNNFKVFITTKPEHGLYTILTTYHFLHDSLSETNPRMKVTVSLL